MSKLDEYKALLMNADSLDILYITAESTDFHPTVGELVALTAVNASGNIVLDLRFDVDCEWTGEEFHGITKDQIAGLPRAVEVLDELRHFLNEKSYYCWSRWYQDFFFELLGKNTQLKPIKAYIVCNRHMRQIVSIDSDATLREAAVILKIEDEENLQGVLEPERKAKLGFAITKKVMDMSAIIDRIDELEQKLRMANVHLHKCFYDDEYRTSPVKPREDDIPF